MDVDLDGAKYILKRVTTSLTSKPAKPQIEIDNPFDEDSHIHAFGFIPNGTFKTNGIIQAELNDREFLEQTVAGDFTDLDDFNMPIPEKGIRFHRGKKLKIFIWSGSGSVTLLFGVLLSEK